MRLQHLTFPGAYAAHLQLRKTHTFYKTRKGENSVKTHFLSTNSHGFLLNECPFAQHPLNAATRQQWQRFNGNVTANTRSVTVQCFRHARRNFPMKCKRCHAAVIQFCHTLPLPLAWCRSSSSFPTTSRWFRPTERYPRSYYWEGGPINIHKRTLRHWTVAEPRQQSI